jgi:hypothetical protein
MTDDAGDRSAPPAALTDDTYMGDDLDNFTGPFRDEWERRKEDRIRAQEEEERREADLMAARAAAAREEFLRKVAAEKAERLRQAAVEAPRPPPIDPDDLAGGWQRVMAMVGPKAGALPPAKARQVKNLYFQLKS